MIPQDSVDVLETGLRELEEFGTRANVRGRFVAVYLALRRMGSALAPLGSATGTPMAEIEHFLDELFTKTHRPEPLVVLTALFGQSTSPTAPYSTRSGQTAPGNTYPTNTWRNNFGIQKGVGCPAEPGVINALVKNPAVRLACPHMALDPEGRHACSIAGTVYRGDEHSIWLRMTKAGYQVVDLDLPEVYEDYLRPSGTRIPVFPLIAVLYSFSAPGVYPSRTSVGIPEFAQDYAFSLQQVADLFDCDPDSPANNATITAVQDGGISMKGVLATLPGMSPSRLPGSTGPSAAPPGALPVLGPDSVLNTGVGAELAVAADLESHGWSVSYRGNQRAIGYDLEAVRGDEVLRVEVKSSVSFTTPELTEGEWGAAQGHGDEYVLAIVDFFGSHQQSIWYIRDPAAAATPVERRLRSFKLPRTDIQGLATEAEFL